MMTVPIIPDHTDGRNGDTAVFYRFCDLFLQNLEMLNSLLDKIRNDKPKNASDKCYQISQLGTYRFLKRVILMKIKMID